MRNPGAIGERDGRDSRGTDGATGAGGGDLVLEARAVVVTLIFLCLFVRLGVRARGERDICRVTGVAWEGEATTE